MQLEEPHAMDAMSAQQEELGSAPQAAGDLTAAIGAGGSPLQDCQTQSPQHEVLDEPEQADATDGEAVPESAAESQSQSLGADVSILSAAALAAVQRAEALQHSDSEAAAGAYHQAAMQLLHAVEDLGPDERRGERGVQMQQQAERLAARAAELREQADTCSQLSQDDQEVQVDEEAPEEAVPSLLAGVNLQRITPPKPPGTQYRCIGNAVIRKGCAMDSDKAKIDKLEAGQEITVLERVTLDDGTVRLRFEDGFSFGGMRFGGGWTSGVTKAGKVLVERLDSNSDEDEADPTETLISSAVLKDKVVALYFASALNENCQSFTPKLKRFYEVVAEREAAGSHSVAELAKGRLVNAAAAAAAVAGTQTTIAESQAVASASKEEDDQAEHKGVEAKADEGAQGLEIVFVSSDTSAAAAVEHMESTHGTWLAVPFHDFAAREALTKRYVRGGLPALVVIHEPTGTVLSARAKEEVLKADELLKWNTECFEEWRSKTIDGPTAIDDFAAKANEALLGAAVTAASFFARAGAKAAEHVPQLSEEEKNKKMSLSGRAALASASSVASVAAYATGGTISKGASACKVAKSVNDLRSSGGSGKVGKAVAVAQRTGISSGAEAQELKRTTSGTASRLLASLSEAAEIVAAGANKGVAEAVEARYGEDVAKRISEALPGDKESAVLLPGADTTGDSVSITAASKNPELGCPTQSEQQASTKLQPEPQSESQSEPQLEPQSEAQLEQQLEPEIASKTLPQLAALTTALAVRTGRGDPEQDEDVLFRRCSWCLNHTDHSIKTRNKVRRSVYTCTGCSKDTLACKTCDKKRPTIDLGMAKETPMYSYDQCATCKGDIKAWPDDVITRHCSWCLKRTQHALKVRNKVRRSIYTCQNCAKDTVQCKVCAKEKPACPAMAKDTQVYSYDKCVLCSDELEEWPVESANPSDTEMLGSSGVVEVNQSN